MPACDVDASDDGVQVIGKDELTEEGMRYPTGFTFCSQFSAVEIAPVIVSISSTFVSDFTTNIFD